MSVMKKAAVVAAGFVVLAGGTARAAAVDVKVPFPFVVRGQTLPAGQYSVERTDNDSPVVLIRGENGTKASLVVMTKPARGHDPAGSKPVLTFKKYENQYRLTDIWESADQGREVAGRR